jgi:nicotinamide-nucleotide amidase
MPSRFVLKTLGVPEDEIRRLIELAGARDDVTVALEPAFPEVHITVAGAEADAVEEVRSTIAAAIGADCVYSCSPGEDLERVVNELLWNKQLTLAVAESCTAGMIAARLTATPGASLSFLGGVIAYANSAKIALLQVSPELLDREGAVSAPTVKLMADGVRRAFAADIGLSITGIAGPTGGSAAKPVGTFYVGLSLSRETMSFHFMSPGTRQEVRRFAAATALDLLRRRLAGFRLENLWRQVAA